MTYAAFVRSPHAHARIRRIDIAAASKHPGVVAIFTGKDMTGVNSLPCGWDLRKAKNIPGVVQDLAIVPHMPLTSDVARHVGDPVAVVIADSQTRRSTRGEGTGGLGTAAGGDRHREGDASWGASDPRRRAGQRRLQVGDRRPGRHRRRVQERSGDGQEAHRQPAPCRQRHGAARVRGPLRGRDRRPDALGNVPEPTRAPAAHVRLRARHPGAQGTGDRARRRRRVRFEDLPL